MRPILFLACLLGATTGAALAHWPYGAATDGYGGIVFLEWPKKRVVRVAADGTVTRLADLSKESSDQNPHAIARGPDGAYYVAATYSREMWRIDADGVVKDYAPVTKENPLPPGDFLNLAFGPEGRLHLVLAATEEVRDGTGPRRVYRLVRIGKDGTHETLLETREGEAGWTDLYGACFAVDGEGTVWIAQGKRLCRVEKGMLVPVVTEGLGRAWTVVAEPGGNLLVLDVEGARILRVGADAKPKEVVTGLERPFSFTRTKDSRLLIGEETAADTYRIRRFTPGEELETLATVGPK